MTATYREYRPAGALRPIVACTWEHKTVEKHSQLVVPDGCVDLIWMGAGELVVAGADTQPRQRQLRRRTLVAVGYGPKMLARINRLRRLIALGGDSLASRALEAGYASQAHMGDEVRRLTGSAPVRFLEDAALTAA